MDVAVGALGENNTNASGQTIGLPSEIELVLLCLDYLRDLRREYPAHLLRSIEGIDADYLTVACWALNRSFVSPNHMRRDSDAYFTRGRPQSTLPAESLKENLPTLATMEKEILHPDSLSNSEYDGDQKKEDTENYWYEYDDSHASNIYRFYPLNGLASGPALKGSLTLGELATAGLASLGARSRLDAEKEMIQSPLFDQFLQAVQSRGFFDSSNASDFSDLDGDDSKSRKQKLYEDRYRKVVAKFRHKLASKAESETTGDLVAHSATEKHRQRRRQNIENSLSNGGLTESKVARQSARERYASTPHEITDNQSVISSTIQNPVDIEEAEKLKSLGNTHMQDKEFQEAADCYTKALRISPAGPHSHVYFSNRAAAMVSMKRFDEAILDSERSLALRPDYGKAHARLGLAHFLLGNYRQAMEAYTVALKYEPDSKSSKNYLEKAAKKLAETGEMPGSNLASSFSVVSEWEKSTSNRQASPADVNDEKEAEKYKTKGNAFMAKREYRQAFEAYGQAIKCCPTGSNSHVYYSNRAASLCYLERYAEAEMDSVKSLALNPSYGKAHARLGLSRFFLKDYSGAVAAYTSALKYDPDNSASKSYLAKAKAKLEMERDKRLGK